MDYILVKKTHLSNKFKCSDLGQVCNKPSGLRAVQYLVPVPGKGFLGKGVIGEGVGNILGLNNV